MQDTVGAGSDLLGRLPTRRAVAPDRPVRHLAPDVDRRTTLVLPVVPLHQAGANLGDLAEAGQPAGLGRPRERARQHEHEAPAAERQPHTLGRAPSVLGERDVGTAGVAIVRAPIGLAVANQDDLVRHPLSLTGPVFEGWRSERCSP